MSIKSTLKRIEKKMQDIEINIWYEFDWSEWSNEELRQLVNNVEVPEHLIYKIKLKKADPQNSVSMHSNSYISFEKAQELEKKFPNVKL